MTSQAEPAIIVKDVKKSFRIPLDKTSGIKQLVVNIFKRKKGYREFTALNGVSFEIKKGEFFGIVGRNGSGKSTLLKILAGVYTPDSGGVAVNGSLTPFIELGVGFNPELSGRENVFLNGALLGFSREEMETMYDDIVDFAELHDFMEERLKNYSSGMQVRLAFSIAIRADTDILLLDEVLAVGDDLFQKKCFDYFAKLKQSHKTVILVSHDRASLERFCDKAVLIENGVVVSQGPISKITEAYSNILLEDMSVEDDPSDGKNATTRHKRSDVATIMNVKTYDEKNKETQRFLAGKEMRISFDINFKQEVTRPVVGVTVRQKDTPKPIFATNTLIESITTGTYRVGQTIRFNVVLPGILNDGDYSIEPAVADEWAKVFYDRQPDVARFSVSGSSNPYSILAGASSVEVRNVSNG